MQTSTTPTPSEEVARPKVRSRRSIALFVMVLGVLTATGPLATDMYLPAFPQITRDLGTSEAQIGLTLTAIMLGLAAGQLVIGPMSDAWGRRRPLLVGVALFTVTSVLCVFVPNVTAFIVLRFAQGVAGAAGAVIARAVVRDMFQGDDAVRFFSRLALVMMLAPLLAPLVGAQLLLVGPWQLSFWVLAAMAALAHHKGMKSTSLRPSPWSRGKRCIVAMSKRSRPPSLGRPPRLGPWRLRMLPHWLSVHAWRIFNKHSAISPADISKFPATVSDWTSG